jgi:hypothetical protein
MNFSPGDMVTTKHPHETTLWSTQVPTPAGKSGHSAGFINDGEIGTVISVIELDFWTGGGKIFGKEGGVDAEYEKCLFILSPRGELGYWYGSAFVGVP